MARLSWRWWSRRVLLSACLLLLLAPGAVLPPAAPAGAVSNTGYLIAFTAALDIDFLDVERGGIFLSKNLLPRWTIFSRRARGTRGVFSTRTARNTTDSWTASLWRRLARKAGGTLPGLGKR